MALALGAEKALSVWKPVAVGIVQQLACLTTYIFRLVPRSPQAKSSPRADSWAVAMEYVALFMNWCNKRKRSPSCSV
jgi:hypothetical protein